MRVSVVAILIFTSVSANAQTKDGIFQLDREYAINQTGTIKLNSSDAKVHITGSKRSNAHVKIYRQVTTRGIVFGHDEFDVEVSEENGDLSIRERSNSTVVGMVGYTHETYTIHVEAPEGVSLQVRGDDGDYFLNTIAGSISLDLDDADVDVPVIQAKPEVIS